MNFANGTFEPVDREYFLAQENIFMTLGRSSYVGGMNLITDPPIRPKQILIGRYSSSAWDIKFLIGHSHVYDNVVSTFPFGNKIVKKPLSAVKEYRGAVFEQSQHKNQFQVTIGSDVWIGCGTTIRGGIKIGSGAIIGTEAMVTKDIPPYAIAVGNPIKIIKYRFDEETIKKFMAVKWWNWDVDKVLDNVQIMNDPEKFLEKHYRPELEIIPEDSIWEGEGIENLLADKKNIYTFVGDMHTPQPMWNKNIPGFTRTVNMPMWKRVISGFCQSNFEDSALIIWTGKNSNSADVQILRDYIETFKNDAGKNIFIIPSTDEKIYSPYILRNSTHFITSREMTSLECMDWLWDTDVKIISSFDDGIFDGEPYVKWNEIF